jgi:hypothetical protein
MEGWKTIPVRYSKNLRMEAKSKQGLYKWKIRSLVTPGTTQMEGWKPSPINDYKNGWLEAKSLQGLYTWKDRRLVISRTTQMEGYCTNGRMEAYFYQGV